MPEDAYHMIEKIHIQDYRSCHDTTFEPQPDLSVLIGPNGSGKTTVLNACLLMRQLIFDRRRHEDETATDECGLKVWFRVNGKRAIFNTKIKLYTEGDNSDVIVGAHQTWYAKDFTGSGSRLKMPISLARQFGARRRTSSAYWHDSFHYHMSMSELSDIPESFQASIGLISEHVADIKYYSASQFTNPSDCPVSIEVEKAGRSSRGVGLRRGHTRFLYDLYRAHKSEKREGYEEFLSVIGPDGIGLVDEITFQEILTSSVEHRVRSGGQVRELKREKLLVIPQFTIGANALSPSQLSEGTFKTITLLFYVMTERSSSLLIEEPEVCVHQGLLSSIVELIKTYSKQKQIIVSTHSDFVLDKIDPQNVYVVSRDPTEGTRVRNIAKTMSHDDLVALKEYLETEGNLGEYWRHGGLE